MNKKNIIITCVSASLAITLIFLGIIFSFKKPAESNKKDDDQTLKKEVEALKNEFKTLKSNFVIAFNELQSKDFAAYPSEDQKQIDHLKKELQTFQNKINQLSCDQPELTGQKTCLSTINQQINNKKNDFQTIHNLIHLFNNLNNITNQLNSSALTSLQNLNQTINDTSFTNQTFNNTFNDINNFYHSFNISKQNCFNNKKLKDQKDCFDRLSKELNHNLNLITQISNDYSDQKKIILDKIENLKNELNSLKDYDVLTQQKSKKIKEVNCDQKKKLLTIISCYQKQINQIKEIYNQIINDHQNLISSQLFNLIFNEKISLSVKEKEIKLQLTKEINEYLVNNQYYRIFKIFKFQNHNYDYFSLKEKITGLENNNATTLLALINKTKNFIIVQKEIIIFVPSHLENSPLRTYQNILNRICGWVYDGGKLVVIISGVLKSKYPTKILFFVFFIGSTYLLYNYNPSFIVESDALATDSLVKTMYNQTINCFYTLKSSCSSFELFGSINLAQELNIKITNLENMSADELNDIIQQIKQKEESLIESFNGFTFHKRKLKQIAIIFIYMSTCYGISLSGAKLIELSGKLLKNNPPLNHHGNKNLGNVGHQDHNGGWFKKIMFIPTFLHELFTKNNKIERSKKRKKTVVKNYQNIEELVEDFNNFFETEIKDLEIEKINDYQKILNLTTKLLMFKRQFENFFSPNKIKTGEEKKFAEKINELYEKLTARSSGLVSIRTRTTL